jgi:esterase
MARLAANGTTLYYEEAGEGTPILLVHPSGATGSTWGRAYDELASVGRVIAYDRRGYGRSGGEPVRSVAVHTSDAAAVLEALVSTPAVVVGTSAGAVIALDLAVRRADLLAAAVAHEAPWRFTRRIPTASQVATLGRMAWLAATGRPGDAAETLLRSAYAYRDGGTAWDAFPPEWRVVGRDNARAALKDFVSTIGSYPTATDLAGIRVPVVCTYGGRSPAWMAHVTRTLSAAIPTASLRCIENAGHAAPFDAPTTFANTAAETVLASASTS